MLLTMRLLTTFLILFALSLPLALSSAAAQGKKRNNKATATSSKKGTRSKGKTSSTRRGNPESNGKNAKNTKKEKKEQRFVFSGLDVEGELRAPQLLYFLDRANEELKRASLERRSFIPEMMRSIDEEAM